MPVEKTYYDYLVDIRDQWDSDESLRFEILKWWFSYSFDGDEYTANQWLNSGLNDISSGVWHRERVVGYLMLLQMWLDMIRGKTIPDHPLMTAVRDEYLRAKWLENSKFRDLVEDFRNKLIQAADLFNLQMLNNWLRKIVLRYESLLKHVLLQELVSATVDKDYGSVDRRTYFDAISFADRELAPIFTRLAEEAPDWAKSIVYTPRQLDLIAAVRKGAEISLEEFSLEAAEVVEDLGNQQNLSIIDLINEIDPFKITAGGLWIDKQ